MTPQRVVPEDELPARQVNTILHNLRGEHFRQTRNVQGRPASSSALSSHVHNQPTLPFDLIYPEPMDRLWEPRLNPPKSWRYPASSILWPVDVGPDVDVDTPAWRECALSLLFATGAASTSCGSSSSSSTSASLGSRLIYPYRGPIPPLTFLCLQCIRAACTEPLDLVRVAPHIPVHLRRALMRYTAIYGPLSQVELEALCQGATHVDTELIAVAPHNALREDFFRTIADPRDGETSATTIGNKQGSKGGHPELSDNEMQWDAVQSEEESELRSLAILHCPLTPATMLTFPPTITHLALIDLYTIVPLKRLPTVCPLLVFLDLSYTKWLNVFSPLRGESPIESVKWQELRRLEVLGLRGCLVDRDLLVKVNKGRWEDVKIVL